MTPGWVFCCPDRIWSPAALQPPFDITGDLDTPVSAFMKLAAFEPRFLLESVEGGERLARYSFIGFGDALEVRLDGAGLGIGAQRHPLPASGAQLLSGLRTALAQAPKPEPDIAGVPLAGGLVGYAAYDVVRYLERIVARTGGESGVPGRRYVAARRAAVPKAVRRGRYATPTTAYARADYIAAVRRTHEHIAAGSHPQLVLKL